MSIDPPNGPSGLTSAWLTNALRDVGHQLLQAPLIATLGAAFSATTERGDQMMLVVLERACDAVRSLDAFEIIDREAA